MEHVEHADHEYLSPFMHNYKGCRTVAVTAILFSQTTGKTQEAARHCVKAILKANEEHSLQTCVKLIIRHFD
jgi:uncharacterized protein YggL (DUF469 family)